ncbi:uncharacterized protein [Elaeis guineensis]|uniref:Small subunit processome component 20 homolog n=1 Tax=Elaeis guineensis var. tenera TaxID=51953 RepID=A0A6I9S6Y6_ELAGV|nr:small subunit processome component 20 homolog [Elaeis guineensis]
MATSQSQAVKCLNTSFGRRRFVFKSFSQRVEEIDIDVFRSLEPIKTQPSNGSSFFRESLMQWRELNTAEDFISFYEEMVPLVQTLPQVILHKEKIISELLRRLNMKARLSLEPILMLVAALSRDILEEFLPFLQRFTGSLLDLLKGGADRDPEILEQVFTSWSYILMHLQKYLVKDVVHILKITVRLRFFSRDYIQEFMAESVSFVLRNAPINQLTKGIRKLIFEVAKTSSSVRITGVAALLWHVMRGSSSRLHSRAEKVLQFLMDKSIVSIRNEYPQGMEAFLEVVTGILHRLCSELDHKELKVVYDCLFREISGCISDGCFVHLNHILGLLTFTIHNSNNSRVFDNQKMFELIKLLIQAYITPADCSKSEDISSEVHDRILQLMICLLDVPLTSDELSSISLLYAPAFKLRSSSLFDFIKGVLLKDPHIAHVFRSHIISAMDDSIEDSSNEVLFLMLTFLERQSKQLHFDILDGVPVDKEQKICMFFNKTIVYWTNLISDVATSGNQLEKQISESEVAILWGVLRCYPHFQELPDNLALIKDLIATLDQLLELEADQLATLPKSTWQSLLGAALSSYHKLLPIKQLRHSETSDFLRLAKRHKTSPQVLSAVAEFLDSVFCDKSMDEDSAQDVLPEFDVQETVASVCAFADNLGLPHKAIRISTLKILSHYAPLDRQLPTSDERPHKKLKTDKSGSANEDTQCPNVIELLLLAETTPISVSTSRKITILISRIQMGLSSATVNDGYIPLLLYGIIGILHNRFGLLWEPALECLTILIGRYKELVWNIFIQYLGNYQSKFLSSSDQLMKVNLESPQPIDLGGCFNRFLYPDSDSTPCMTITTLLLQSLQKIPDIAESRSRQLIPLFLKFMGYDDENILSVESFNWHKCKGKAWKLILKEWLNLLRLMRNARSLYRSLVLKEVLMKRLLDDIDPDVQLKVLDCLLNWKDDFLTPYDQHLKNLINSKNLREELTTWALSKESQHIQEGHRGHLIPLIIRLLTPKVRNLKALGLRKHTGLNHRRAVLYFLAQLDVDELQLFFSLLLKPLLADTMEVLEDQPDRSSEKFTDGFHSSVFPKFSTLVTVSNLSWKKRTGFLHVVEDILKTFDEFRVKPFLNPLMMIVVQILENCMLNIMGDNGKRGGSLGDNSAGDSEVHETSTLVPDPLMMNTSIKQFKDLRSLCLKIISFALGRYEFHDFGSDFWDIFFVSVKPLIDSFKQEGSSSEKPSSLFLCFIAMSRSPMLVLLLIREANLVPTIFSILTVKTASDAIISSVLNFIENLLNLDSDLDHQEDNSVKSVLVPHLEILIHSLYELFQSRKDSHRKSTVCPGKTELRIFKLLVKYINDAAASGFIGILLPFFKKRDISTDECMEGLHVIKAVLPVLDYETSGKILKAINPLLVSAGLDLRLCICDVLDGLAMINPSLAFLATLLHELNAVSSSEIGELDYDKRIGAYDTIRPELFTQLREEHALAVLSHCIYDMSSDELIFRQSASRALLSFIHFAGSIVNGETSDCRELHVHDGAQEDATDQTVEKNNTSSTWTKACVQQIVKKTLLQNMGEAMSKDISIQKEWIALLREMVYNLRGIPSLNTFRPLCSEDPEVDFFNNILHLQIHRRRRALSRFRNVISAGKLAENVTAKIFLPLFFNMLFDVKDGKGEDLRNACLETLASMSGQMDWETYRTFLMRCFREMTLKPDKQKILLRLICAVLDMFHFTSVNSRQVIDGVELCASGDTERNVGIASPASSSESNVPSDIAVYLQKKFLPQVLKLLTSESEKVNVNVSLAAIKLLKLLPVETLESQLSSIIHHTCNFLKNRLESLRDEARAALAACARELGLEYLHFLVKVLQAILKRGYELHVLGYTLNFILSKTLVHPTIGKLDYCLEELLLVAENDILGDVAEEKEVEKFASKMKETRKNKSFDTLKLISQSITFRTHASKLLSPINAHLQKQLTPKTKGKLEMMLHHIALGIEHNPSVELSELFIFVYGLIEDSITEEGGHGKEISMNATSNKPLHEMLNKKNTLNSGDHGLQNSHLIAEFALGVLHNRLKNIKLDKKDEQLLSMLDPFIKLLGTCLNSKYEKVLSAAFRCLAPLIRLPLPSLEAHADKIKILLLDIAQKSGNANSSLVQSCLKLLTVLLRSTKISLSNDQLHMLIQFPLFIDLQTNPSPIALSLLKSIVGRKLVVHEIYDIAVRVAEVMVTSQSEPIRKKCSQILLQFLLDYRLSDKRLQQHMDFLLTNLSYEHSSGREAVLEMLHAILVKFPKSVVDSQAQTFFLHLVVALANDRDQKVQSMVATVIKVLIGRTSRHALHSILDYSLSWYLSEKKHLWSAAAQVLGLLVEVLRKDFHRHISSILQVTKGIFKSSMHAVNKEFDFANDPSIPFWKEAYYSLVMLEKMLLQFPELYFDKNLEELWGWICKLLLHPHVWLRNISNRLVALYFAAVSDPGRTDIEKLNIGTLFLVKPSKLFAVAASLLNQLKLQLDDDAACNLITQNLVFSVCGLHSFAKQRNSLTLHEFWCTLDSCEQGSYLEAFELLGSRKIKNAFLLSTSNTSQSSAERELAHEDDAENFQSLLVAPLLKRMGKVAMQKEDIQMKIIFNCFRMISSQIGSEGCNAYAIHMLVPLYKVCEGFAGKVIGDEIKQLALEVRDSIRDVLGVDEFVRVYNLIRKNLKGKREKRKQEQKLVAVINPMRHAKRKLRIAAKHRAHKKRKILAMKMGTWRR